MAGDQTVEIREGSDKEGNFRAYKLKWLIERSISRIDAALTLNAIQFYSWAIIIISLLVNDILSQHNQNTRTNKIIRTWLYINHDTATNKTINLHHSSNLSRHIRYLQEIKLIKTKRYGLEFKCTHRANAIYG